MKVLHINCNYIGTTLHQLMIEELQEKGIENEVFVPTYDKNIATITPNNNVYVSECFKKWDRLAFDYKQNKIIKEIEKHYDVASFDLIHAYTLFTDGNAARVLSEKYGVPFVVAVRNTDVNTFFKKILYLRNRGIKTMLEAQKVFFLSPAYKNEVLKRYVPEKYREKVIKKTEIIPNGIDTFWFDNLYKERGKGENENQISQRKIKLVYAGGIDKNKNVTATCKAIDLLKEDGWSVEFTVVGRIKDQTVFEDIKDKVTYLTARPKEQLIDVYRKADIFVMPSLTESFGLVYVEAMTQGLPVIYSRGQGFDDQFPDGAIGKSVDPRKIIEIAQAVKYIAENYSRMSESALKNSIFFKWSKICETYKKIYSAINFMRI